MGLTHRFAYSYITRGCADPGAFIRRTLEEGAGHPPFRLAASSRDTMLVVFPDAYVRDAVLQLSPFQRGDHTLLLKPHEDADNRL